MPTATTRRLRPPASTTWWRRHMPTLRSRLAPSSVSVAPGGIVQFTTSRPADETVMWTQDGGSITIDTGFYQAPAKPGTYHVSAYDFEGLLIATAEVTVRPDPVYVTIHMPHLIGQHPGDGAAYRAIAGHYRRGTTTAARFAGPLGDTATPPLQFDVDGGICRILDANGVEPRAGGGRRKDELARFDQGVSYKSSPGFSTIACLRGVSIQFA